MKLLIILLLTMNSAFADCNLTGVCNVQLVKLHDGDTFFINLTGIKDFIGKRLGVRVKGIDTAELNTQEGKIVRDYARNMFESASKIDIYNCTKGKYFRIVCDVRVDNINYGDHLIKTNRAKAYRR